MKNSLLVALFLIFATAIQNSHARQLTMQKAVILALQHRPSVKALTHELTKQKLNEKAAWSHYLPEAKLLVEVNQKQQQKHPQVDTRIEASQLIYDPAGPQIQAKKALSDTQALEQHQELFKNKIRLAVEETYLECWKLQQQYKSIKADLFATKSNIKKIRHQKKIQLINQNEYLSQLDEQTKQLYNIQHYHDALLSLEKHLAFLTGNIDNIALLPKKKSSFTKIVWPYKHIRYKKVTYYQQLAKQYRHEIKELEKQIESAQYAHTIAAYRHLPRFCAVGSAGHRGGKSFGKHGHHNIGARMEWSFSDHNQSNIEASRAHAQKLSAELNKQEVVAQISNEVTQAYTELSQACNKLKSKHISYMRGKNEFNLRRQEYALGTISKNDFQQAKAAWNRTIFDWITHKANLGKKYQKLLYTTGYPSKYML